MASTYVIDARILTLTGGDGPRRNEALRELGVIERGYVHVDGERIAAVEPGDPPSTAGSTVINADGCVLMPAFTDCHTHACWAGERFDEWELKLRGATYLQILESGGGIMSTVRAVRRAGEDELVDLLRRRLARMAALGTAGVEIKSGYGLDTATELKMLRAIRRVSQQSPMTITPTFLGAHAIDPDNPNFIRETIEQTLPAVVDEFPGITCDAYCEQGAWSFDDTVRLFEKARQLGCPVRVHADQFNAMGMTSRAVDMNAVSVDHLEATDDAELKKLADSDTFGVALPCSGFQLDDRYAPARRFIDMGGALAIATNYNPGSAPTPSMPFAIALACRKLGLSPAEAITCATFNAACVLGQHGETGSIEIGKRADLQLLDVTDEREIAYEFATPGPQLVMIGGHLVHRRRTNLIELD